MLSLSLFLPPPLSLNPFSVVPRVRPAQAAFEILVEQLGGSEDGRKKKRGSKRNVMSENEHYRGKRNLFQEVLNKTEL